MKKRILAAVLLLALTLTALCSCFGSVAERGDVTVVIENRDGSYTEYKVYLEKVENKSEGAVGILENLSKREKNPLPLDMSNGPYGKFLNSIGTLTPDASENEFISIYTSVEKDFGTFLGAEEIDYGGTLLKSAGVGMSSLTIESGTVILFRIEKY